MIRAAIEILAELAAISLFALCLLMTAAIYIGVIQ